MSRIFIITDARGEQKLQAQDLPLQLGGEQVGDIVMPGIAAGQILGYVALSEGHAFLQSADDGLPLFHNHEQISGSCWLKSGDEVRFQDAVMDWRVQGDMTFITCQTRPLEQAGKISVADITLTPPQRTLPDVAPQQTKPRSFRVWQWLLLCAFLILLLVSAFVLFATPVAIKINPQPDQQSISGFPPPLSLGDRLLALPGEYTLTASLEGYLPLQTQLTVLDDGLQTFEWLLEERPGQVTIQLEPAVDYRVWLAETEMPTNRDGVTAIPGGMHTLRIETERYLPVIAEVEIAGLGQSQTLSYPLQPGWADVSVTSDPAGASVLIDGEIRGVTPVTIEVMAGVRNLDLALDLYKTASIQQQVLPGEVIQLDTVTLQPADAQLTVTSQPSGATVSVAGTFQGTTPAILTVASRQAQLIRFAKPGYQTVDKSVTLQAAEQHTLDVSLPPEYGVVFVTARPADAQLLVDGKLVGDATRRLRLTTRAHSLTFSKKGYKTRQLTVTPRAGVSKKLDITLKTSEQVAAERKAARAPAVLTAADGQQLRLIKPEGHFRMGASRREAGRRANESARLIALKRSFYLSEKEVTNAQYQAFKASHNSGSAEGVSLNTATLPVVNVSWDDAARFCNWLSEQDGLPVAYREVQGKLTLIDPVTTGYRLPTETEWAYAARSYNRESAVRYSWAGAYPPTGKAGNFADASIADTLASTVPDYNDGYRGPAPPGSFPAQSGFYDLSGNVAEWVQDYYAVYPGMSQQVVTDPAGPVSGDHHVVRGSSWLHGGITELRLSYRDYSRGPRPDLGFRIARYAE